MIDVLLVGEPMAMFIADEVGPLEEIETFHKALAGAEVNVAIGLSRLGHKPAYMTKLGVDPFATYIKNCLKKDNIATDYVSQDDRYVTGFQLKGKVTSGDPPVAYYRKNSAASHMSIADIQTIDFSKIKQVHITGILPALSKSCFEATLYLAQQAKAAGVYVSFDPNLRPVLWESEAVMAESLNKIAAYADMIMPGVSEGKILTGYETPEEIARFYHDMGIETVVVKVGAKGAYASQSSEAFYVEGFKADVVDTVGAGDAFAVGLLSAKLEGLTLQQAVTRANATGCMQVMVQGDNEGLPTQEELKDFLHARNKL